jgi:hypothetical protein
MLEKELRSEPYNKTAHRGALARLLNDRSDGSIERKHQNVSAVLIELGYPYIDGYKPLSNYQRLLAEVVAERVAADRRLESTVASAVTAPASAPTVNDILDRVEKPPEFNQPSYSNVRERLRHEPRIGTVNYLEREARNASLGKAGGGVRLDVRA